MADDYKDLPPLPPRYRLRDVIWGENMFFNDDDRYPNLYLSRLLHFSRNFIDFFLLRCVSVDVCCTLYFVKYLAYCFSLSLWSTYWMYDYFSRHHKRVVIYK